MFHKYGIPEVAKMQSDGAKKQTKNKTKFAKKYNELPLPTHNASALRRHCFGFALLSV